MRKIILINFFIILAFYIAGVVSAASFNIFDWHETVREIVSMFWLALAIIINGALLFEEK